MSRTIEELEKIAEAGRKAQAEILERTEKKLEYYTAYPNSSKYRFELQINAGSTITIHVFEGEKHVDQFSTCVSNFNIPF